MMRKGIYRGQGQVFVYVVMQDSGSALHPNNILNNTVNRSAYLRPHNSKMSVKGADDGVTNGGIEDRNIGDGSCHLFRKWC